MPRFDYGDEYEAMVALEEVQADLEREQRGMAAFERQVERDEATWQGRVDEALRQRDACQEALMVLIDIIEATPFHAYCESRRYGHPPDRARVVNEWMGDRDRAFNVARGLVF